MKGPSLPSIIETTPDRAGLPWVASSGVLWMSAFQDASEKVTGGFLCEIEHPQDATRTEPGNVFESRPSRPMDLHFEAPLVVVPVHSVYLDTDTTLTLIVVILQDRPILCCKYGPRVHRISQCQTASPSSTVTCRSCNQQVRLA